MADLLMKLAPWGAPNFARAQMPPGKRGDGLRDVPCIPVRDLSQEALDRLAAEWLAELYDKAGKPCPWSPKLEPTDGN